MDPGVIECSTREIVIINALRILEHTKTVDPEFVQQCKDKLAAAQVFPGFPGGMLEQNEQEFSQLLEHVKGCHSALEIGSRYGKSLERIALALEPRSRVVSVDLGINDAVGRMPDPAPVLKESVKNIGLLGHETHLFLGDSHSAQLVAAVQALGPYDFLFIDGDHTYEGAKADWENFGPHAKIVAFHDIVNNVDCARLWREIRAKHRTIEYTDSVWLGIGVVLKDN